MLACVAAAVEVQLKRESVADYEQVRVQVAYALAANASAFSAGARTRLCFTTIPVKLPIAWDALELNNADDNAGSVAFPASSALAEHVARIAVTEIGARNTMHAVAVLVPTANARRLKGLTNCGA